MSLMPTRHRSLGQALRRTLGRERLPRVDIAPDLVESMLMNPERFRILLLAHQWPLLGEREFARAIGLSQGALRWHLPRLEGRGLLQEIRWSNRRGWMPPGYLNEETISVLPVWNEPVAQLAYRRLKVAEERGAIFRRDPRVADRTWRRRLSDLARVGLVTTTGRQWSTTDRLAELRASHRERIPRTARRVVEVLQAEGLAPKLVRRAKVSLSCEVLLHGDWVPVRVRLDPFSVRRTLGIG